MKHTLKGRVLPVLVGAAVVVTGANIASYAADGHVFRLGARNSEDHATSVTNTGTGPAFRFNTGDGIAPFAVNSGVKVAHLNATRLDGLKAGELSRSYRYVLPTGADAGGAAFQASDLPPGHYDVSFDVVTEDQSDTGAPPPVCFVADSAHQFAIISAGQVFGGTAIINGSGPVTVTSTGEAGIFCETTGTISSPVGGQFRNMLTFTRVQSVHKGTPAPLSGPVVKRAERAWRSR
ncbi:MAG: hypothetical protein QM747_10265 [Nocardioides sp.]